MDNFNVNKSHVMYTHIAFVLQPPKSMQAELKSSILLSTNALCKISGTFFLLLSSSNEES